MAKKVLSLALALALIMTCFSGISMITTAEELPAPFGYFNFTGTDGATNIQASGGVVRYITTVETNDGIPAGTAIGDTGLYGYTVDTANYGLYFGGKILNDVPDNTGITYAIEYYIDSDTAPAGTVITVNGGYGNRSFVGLPVKQQGVVLYTLTAAQVDEIQANEYGGDTRLRMYITGEGVGKLYVTGVKIVDSQYTDLAEDPGYACYDFSTTGTCDYYPNWPVSDRSNMEAIDSEQSATFVGYRYFKVYGEAKAENNTTNKPVYIKIYTKAGHENTTITIDTYQIYGSRNDGTGMEATHSSLIAGAPTAAIVVKNGVGGIYMPATCFLNSGAGAGSFRFNRTVAEAIARIEVYDVATYCNEAKATDEMKAELHAGMLANVQNVTTTGYKAPTTEEDGYSGVVACATCGDTITEGTTLPKLSKYAQLDFNDADAADLTAVKAWSITDGNTVSLQKLPNSEDYGLRITGHNTGIQFNLNTDVLGIDEADLANGTKLAVSVEYYMPSALGADTRISFISSGSKNMALYGKWSDTCWDSVCVNQSASLTRNAPDVATFTIGKDVTYHAPGGQFSGNDKITTPVDVETLTFAKNLVNGNTITLYAWNNQISETNPVYVKSITVYSADELAAPQVEANSDYYFFDYPTSPVYYPQYGEIIASGISYKGEYPNTAEYNGGDTDKQYPRFNYGYVTLTGDSVAKTSDGVVKPVEIRFTRKADSGLKTVAFQYQNGDGTTWSGMQTLTFGDSDTVSFVANDAVLQNQLNGQSSIRLRDDHYVQSGNETDGYTFTLNANDDMTNIALIEVIPVTECTHESTTIANKKDATCTTEGYTGDKVCTGCGETVEQGEVVGVLGHDEVIDAAKDATCTETGLTAGKHCNRCGETLTAQETVPANGHTPVTDAGKEPTCTDTGLTEGKHCSVCQEVLVEQETVDALGHRAEPLTDGMWNAKHYCANGCGEIVYDLQALLDKGGEIVLDRDVYANGPLTVSGTVVLDLNGHKLYAGDDTVGDGVLYVPAGGDLTINGDGTVSGVGQNNYCIAIWADGGKVTINGGTYTNRGAGADDHYDLIYVKNGGEVVINGGTFEAQTPVWTLNSHDTLKGTFTVCGGSFYGYDPANNITENPTLNWVADGYKAMADGEYYTVAAHTHDGGTLQNAVEAVINGDAGYTGDLVCSCGDVLEYGKELKITFVGGLYCENGKAVPYKGLIEYEGDLYYIGNNGRVVTGRYFISRLNGLLEKGGAYYFDENGAMIDTGVYDGYYYEDGKVVPYKGMVKDGDDMYYIAANGAVKTGRYAISTTNGLVANTGIYYFGENGVLQTNVVAGGYYYGNDGRCVAYRGLVEVDGDYYYVADNGKVIVNNAKFYVTNVNQTGIAKGFHAFDADGKMIVG